MGNVVQCAPKMQRSSRIGVRLFMFCAVCIGLFLCSLPVSAATVTFTPGWDEFGQPLDYAHSYVSYTAPTPRSLDILFYLVGAEPGSHDVGIHQFIPSGFAGDCNALTFGQFMSTSGCGWISRQGVSANVDAFEFGTLTTDNTGYGTFEVLVTGLAPGEYDLEFTVRQGPTCPGSNCDAIYQSPGPTFGDTVTIDVGTPEPASLVLFGTAALGILGMARRRKKL